ncbi:unnamed protein product [Paramecium sonneborni]|uniref:Uncharacterized protein n=1 Tax=Paramecium sonneborni TaxID=65129 RepID=A0A8S1RQ47_9CILI|nr:unnamed protein product [Paramecium sonneborni]
MNMSDENLMSEVNSTNWKEQTIVKEFDYYNKNKYMVEKTKIEIKFTSDHQIIYLKNEAILRVEQLYVLNYPQILNNVEQIQSLTWNGQFDLKKKKEGKCIASWNGKVIMNVGGYYKNGLKQGLWLELFKNYWRQFYLDFMLQIIRLKLMKQENIRRIQEQPNGITFMKIRQCVFYHYFRGGGLYNNEGKKTGKWIELDERFQLYKQVIFTGEYNMKGRQMGNYVL